MRTPTTILILIILLTFSCANDNDSSVAMRHVSTTETPKNTDTTVIVSIAQNETIELVQSERDFLNYNLPIHGVLNQKQINLYYPNILDTIRDRRIIGSEPIEIKTNSDFHVSMLHNTGTFDQMFLCIHDNNFKLLDSYYIGTATMFERTSHTIEYKEVGDGNLEFYHVQWGWVNKTGEEEIDTLSYNKYILTIAENGNIIKK